MTQKLILLYCALMCLLELLHLHRQFDFAKDKEQQESIVEITSILSS